MARAKSAMRRPIRLAMDKVASAIVGERLAVLGSFATTFSAHVGIGMLPIIWYGTPEQKQKYLPKLVTGEWVGAYALSEASSGSDAMSLRTRAVLSPDGQHYILNGEKMWITNAGFADLYTVFAKVDGEKFTAFLIERDTPGFAVGAEENKLGIGAEVKIFDGADEQKWTVPGASGYLRQGPAEIGAGLGTQNIVDVLRIVWPTGTVQHELQVQAPKREIITEFDRRETQQQ